MIERQYKIDKPQGIFISVEGIDGAGKTTHVEFIRNYLQEQYGLTSIITREPGGTGLGEELRNLLLHGSHHIEPITELFLMFASRQELISKIIVPNLVKGVCVITDRFIDASIAYQGFGRGIGIDAVNKLANLLKPTLKPDLTFLFDVSLKTAFERVAKHAKQDRIELEHEQFFAKVKHGYLSLAKQDQSRIKVLDTGDTIAKTQQLIIAYLDELLLNNGYKRPEKL